MWFQEGDGACVWEGRELSPEKGSGDEEFGWQDHFAARVPVFVKSMRAVKGCWGSSSPPMHTVGFPRSHQSASSVQPRVVLYPTNRHKNGALVQELKTNINGW